MEDLTLGFLNLHQLICPVKRQSDGPCLLAESLHDRLSDPPYGIGDEMIALFWLEFLKRGNKTYVSLIDEIRESHSLPPVFFCHRDNEAKVGIYDPVKCLLISRFRLKGKLILLFICEHRNLIYLLKIDREDLVLRIKISCI